jgi:hypothetical protein
MLLACRCSSRHSTMSLRSRSFDGKIMYLSKILDGETESALSSFMQLKAYSSELSEYFCVLTDLSLTKASKHAFVNVSRLAKYSPTLSFCRPHV